MFYTYVLKSNKNFSYYIGSTTDIERRLKQHNAGFVKSTKRNIPWILVYKEVFENLKSARQRELQIKHWKKRQAIERLIKTSQN